MDAKAMVDGVAIVNLDRCIGCGNCVVLCPENANSLQKKEQEMVPPDNKEAYYKTLLSHKPG
jgi:Fe-S-cluster-containing hydrogenase component 2